MLADKVQQNAPIDFPRCPTCGNAKILGVDFAQTEGVLHEFVQVSANISQPKFRGQTKKATNDSIAQIMFETAGCTSLTIIVKIVVGLRNSMVLKQKNSRRVKTPVQAM